jgi:hypothetical protein
MSILLGYVAMVNSSVQGIEREFTRAAKAGDRIARAGAMASEDTISLSKEALSLAGEEDDAPVGWLEKPMVDLRIAKYSAIANMKVIRTADEMAHELTDLVPRKP